MSQIPGKTSPIKRICVFGDSLQDNGNLAKVLGFPLAPFDNGRFCNGPVASEYLAEMIHDKQATEVAIINYAIGGALTSGKNPKSQLTRQAFPVGGQIDRFVSQEQRFNPDDVILLNGGGNNFIFALHDEAPYLNLPAVYRVADDLFQHASRIAALGGRHMLLCNVPDVTVAPAFNVSPFPAVVTKLVKKFLRKNIKKQNQKLIEHILELRRKYPFVQIRMIDLHTFQNGIFEDPKAYGFDNAVDPCVESFGGVDSEGNIQHDIEIKGDPETYLFWDYVHPTSKVQKIIAEKMYQQLYALDSE